MKQCYMFSYKDFFDCTTLQKVKKKIVETSDEYFVLKPYYLNLEGKLNLKEVRSEGALTFDAFGFQVSWSSKTSFSIVIDNITFNIGLILRGYFEEILVNGNVFYTYTKSGSSEKVPYLVMDSARRNYGFVPRQFNINFGDEKYRGDKSLRKQFYVFFLGCMCLLYDDKMTPVAIGTTGGYSAYNKMVWVTRFLYTRGTFTKSLLLAQPVGI